MDPQSIVLATLAASLVLFVTDALRYDAVAILVVLVLAGTGCLDHVEAFSNFAHPAVVLVGSMYAFAAAVSRTGITEGLCNRLLDTGSRSEAAVAVRLVLITGVLSSVLSNAAVVATMIPVIGTLSRRTGMPASRLLMPMAYGSLLGGMLTLIGTSKNIAVNGVVEKLGHRPFELFEFTHFGLVLLLVGALYFIRPGRALLPRSRVEESLSEHYQVPKFVTEVLVEPGSRLINRSVAEMELFETTGVSLLGLLREGGEQVLAPGPYNRVRSDDVLILQGEPDAIVKVRRELGLKVRSDVQAGDVKLTADDVRLVEAVVPPTSSLMGRTLTEADFRRATNLNVMAISKHGAIEPTRVAETRLTVGDTLLIQGHASDLERVTRTKELIVMDELGPPTLVREAVLTCVLLAGVLLLSALTSINLSVAALGGAVALVLLKCVRADDVRRTIDLSVLILIGGMLSLGMAFQKHGLGDEVARWIQMVGGGIDHPTAVIALLLFTTLVLTQLINYLAAGVLMTPVALALAESMAVSDRPLLMAVMTGTGLAFMSPVAHQANAMVVGPGDYRYRDFLRCGTPLTAILVVVALVMIPILWPLTT